MFGERNRKISSMLAECNKGMEGRGYVRKGIRA